MADHAAHGSIIVTSWPMTAACSTLKGNGLMGNPSNHSVNIPLSTDDNKCYVISIWALHRVRYESLKH